VKPSVYLRPSDQATSRNPAMNRTTQAMEISPRPVVLTWYGSPSSGLTKEPVKHEAEQDPRQARSL
jgi:hypothetical protein